MMTSNPILEIKNLNVTYGTANGPVVALKNINLSLNHNESLGIIGESGCGKSTLSYTILDYLPSNAKRDGKILLKDEDLLQKSHKEMQTVRGNRIAMVYQNPYSALNPSITIGEQLDEVSRIHRGLSKKEAREESIKALKDLSLGEAEGIVLRYPHQVSGGIQQRICISMALLCHPDILILDEPTTALDVTTEASILDIIKDLKIRKQMSMIYISHDIGVINKVSDRIAVMYRGEIVEIGPKNEIFHHPKHPYTRALINCMPRAGVKKENSILNTIPGYVTRRSAVEEGCPFVNRCEKRNDICEKNYGLKQISSDHFSACDRAFANDIPDKEKRAIVTPKKHISRPLDIEFEETEQTPEQDMPLLVLKNVHKYYHNRSKTVRALDGVSTRVEWQDVLGVVGESGCGKSTMGHLIAGLYQPTKGKLLFKNQDIAKTWKHRSKDILQDIQLIFQNPGRSLNPSFTVGQVLDRPILKMLGIKSKQERKKMMLDLLRKVDLGEEYLSRKTTRLSGGEKQRIAVARAFITNPKLIVCDEPTSALDVSVQASVLNLLNELQEQSQNSYIFISHDLNVINYISDHILVMYLGRVCEYGLRDEVVQPPYHPYTESLLSSVPEVDPEKHRTPIRLEGSPPNPSEKIPGCPFASRCHKKIEGLCDTTPPPKKKLSETHYLFCHLDEKDLKGQVTLV
jgi:peptide/nickel transport system ATP-binding protein